MPRELDVTALTDLLRKLGARKPEVWAQSQAEEGIPQLLRWLFLREAWRRIVSEEDPAWIDAHVRRADARPPPWAWRSDRCAQRVRPTQNLSTWYAACRPSFYSVYATC